MTTKTKTTSTTATPKRTRKAKAKTPPPVPAVEEVRLEPDPLPRPAPAPTLPILPAPTPPAPRPAAVSAIRLAILKLCKVQGSISRKDVVDQLGVKSGLCSLLGHTGGQSEPASMVGRGLLQVLDGRFHLTEAGKELAAALAAE
jgi:hypothetical protein